jgi:hypothetical protein
LPLADRFAAPPGVAPPAVAVVMAAGGRLQIRDGPGAAPAPGGPAGAAPEAGAWEEAAAPGPATGGRTRSGCCRP